MEATAHLQMLPVPCLLFQKDAHIIMHMTKQQPASRLRTAVKWLVPIAAIFALAGWIYIAPPGLLGKLDAIGYAVCHRLPSHSLHVNGIQLPLCARCTGEFNAAAIALLFQGFVSGKRGKLPNRGILAVLVRRRASPAFWGSGVHGTPMRHEASSGCTAIAD